MVWIPAASLVMDPDRHYPKEAPAHRVRVDGFWMDKFAVTNRDFERFVNDTLYVTLTEKPVNPSDYRGALTHLLTPSSIVFNKPNAKIDLRNHYNRWICSWPTERSRPPMGF
jgi:formylglycine-generating enzyme required for sulfatase activity